MSGNGLASAKHAQSICHLITWSHMYYSCPNPTIASCQQHYHPALLLMHLRLIFALPLRRFETRTMKAHISFNMFDTLKVLAGQYTMLVPWNGFCRDMTFCLQTGRLVVQVHRHHDAWALAQNERLSFRRIHEADYFRSRFRRTNSDILHLAMCNKCDGLDNFRSHSHLIRESMYRSSSSCACHFNSRRGYSFWSES